MLKRPQRKRPLGIQVIAGAYLGFPLLGPLFMWLTYRDAPDSVLRVLTSLTPGSLVVMASVVLVGVGEHVDDLQHDLEQALAKA